MNSIDNDRALKHALDGLTPGQQCRLGARLIEADSDLWDDARIRRAVEVALDPEAPPELREEAYRSVRAYAIQSYTECGRDTDWPQQAEHFVAGAAAALLADDASAGRVNRAWKAAMHLRNARNCALITQGEALGEDEAARQYRIVEAFLAS